MTRGWTVAALPPHDRVNRDGLISTPATITSSFITLSPEINKRSTFGERRASSPTVQRHMVFTAIVVIIAAGALLCGFTPDPFTWRFDFGVVTLLFGLWALPAWLARALVRRHARLPRIVGWTVAFVL